MGCFRACFVPLAVSGVFVVAFRLRGRGLGGVVPGFLRTLVFVRPCGDDQCAAGTFSPSLDMSRWRRVDHSLEVT